jgi:hypothetical protein
MKHTSSFLLAILLASTITQAQDKNLAIRGGLTLYATTTTGEFAYEHSEIKPLAGFTLGFSYQFKITERFYIQPELNFVKKGVKLELRYPENANGIGGNLNVALNYIEVPCFAKAYFGTDSKFYVLAGPSLGIGVGGKGKYDSSPGSFPVKFGDSESEGDVTLKNRFDLGLNAGAGVRIADMFFVDVRYNLGLSNLSGDNDEPIKNRGFQLSVGVPFSLKKKSE